MNAEERLAWPHLTEALTLSLPLSPAPHSSAWVAEVGLEPTRPCGHRILSPARLPIPPLGQGRRCIAGPGDRAAPSGLWGIDGFASLGPNRKGLDS